MPLIFAFKSTHASKRFFTSRPLCFYSTSTNYLNCHLELFLSNQTSTLQSILRSHALVLTSGNSNNVFIASKLITLYASFNKPAASTKVFSYVFPKDTFLWNSVIKSHFSNGNYAHALDFFLQMRESNFAPNQFTLPMVIAACAELVMLYYGKTIHGLTSKLGLFQGHSAVGSSFVYMYSKCGQMSDASCVFDDITVRDVVAWTAIIIGYVQNGGSDKGLAFLRKMHRIGGDGERPNFRTFEGGFQACGDLSVILEGRCLHSLAVKTGIICSEAVKSSLLCMYSKCGSPEEAYFSFCEIMNKDLFSWTSIIGIYARFGSMDKCLSLFWEMQVGETHPDEIVISCLLTGFGNLMRVCEGKTFHGSIMRRNYVFSNMVHNALLFMYCKLGLLSLAEKLFDSIQDLTKESYSAMISGHNKIRYGAKCIELFRQMQLSGIEADSSSLVSVISSCCQLGLTHLGRSVHCYILKSNRDESVSVANSLIDMYGKNGGLLIAWRVFLGTQRDIITWNSLMSSYMHIGHFFEAIDLFDKMVAEGLTPNSATLVMVLSACSHLSSLEKGKKVHRYIKETGQELNLPLATAIIDMYAKCGQLEKSRELFNSMKERDVISWNVMISGYGMHGHVGAAIELFQEMQNSNAQPNELTFLAILSACNHSGLVEEGRQLFHKIQDFSLKLNLKHYACMVDLLGKSGYLQEAETLVLSMPISPDSVVWGSLLSACSIHNEIERGERVARHAIESDPKNDSYYVMLCNMYSSVGRWEEAENVRKLMRIKGLDKGVGWSVG